LNKIIFILLKETMWSWYFSHWQGSDWQGRHYSCSADQLDFIQYL